jgi:hypothetical protein
MKALSICTLTFALLSGGRGWAQGTFIYDQQSSTDEGPPGYGSGPTMQNIPSPWGQLFTPSINSISFIRLKFDDANINDGLGVASHLNLHSGSITGPILATTASVSLPNGFDGPANFFFDTAIPLTPEVGYYFEPIIDSGGQFNIDVFSYYYPRGYMIYGGRPLTGSELWFREGVYVVPEPSPIALTAIGSGVLAAFARRGNSESHCT